MLRISCVQTDVSNKGLDYEEKWCYNMYMSNRVSDFDPTELNGQRIFAIVEDNIRYAEVHGHWIPRMFKAAWLWEILLIDERAMCEPIADATRYIKASELFFDKHGAEKELFRRKLKGTEQ